MSTTTVNACAGTFYDSGGAAGNYAINQNLTMTFCPGTPNTAVQLNFTTFALENNHDFMYIYDGTSGTAPVLGVYTGTTSPGIIQATGTNTTGCITVRFISDSSTNMAGWAATIACVQQCQQITSTLASSSPAAGADGVIRICQGDAVTFNGAGTFSTSGVGATYSWNFDNGQTANGQTATTTFTNPGVYRVNLTITDPLNCRNTNLLNQVVQVSTTPNITFAKNPPQVCYGYTSDITPTVTPTPFNYQCTPPVSGTTFLPDVPNGVITSYQTSVVVDCFSAGQTLTNMNQLQSICLNMEHSYLGDLQIAITSPSGQTIVLKYYTGGAGSGGGNLHLGHPYDDGDPATDVALGPGIGLDYCFSMAGAVYLVNGPTIPSINTPGTDTVVAGNYLPSQSFAGLVGSLLNGTWTISVTDNLGSDNGYIFSWGLNFDPALVPGNLSFTPTIVSQSWVPNADITATNGNVITVQPSTAGTHCYNYTVTDNFGCTYTASACIDVLNQFPLEDPQDLTVCAGQTFDLTQNIPVMLNGTDPNAYGFLFHHSLADAQNVADPIDPDTAYAGTDGEIIYVSIEDYLTGSACIETRQFVLHTDACGVVTPPDMTLCDANHDGVENFDISGVPAVALGTNTTADYTVTIHLSQTAADAGTGAVDPTLPFAGTDGQQVFIRMESVTDPTHYYTTFFTLHVINVTPPVVSNVTACNSYTLPALPAGQSYNTAVDGTGSNIPANTVITSTQTIWTVAQSGTTPNCIASSSFIVTINQTPATPTVSNVTACDSYTLPTLPTGQSYNTASDGTGTNIPANTVITTTQTIWTIAQTGTTPNCLSSASFVVTINQTPATPVVSNVTACDSYTLPALAAGQSYNTAADGTGTNIPANTAITTTQTIWTVAQTGTTPNCYSSASFTVTINPTPATPTVSNVTACDSYTLPTLPTGQSYNTASDGTGTNIPANTVITATQTIWTVAQTGTSPNCLSSASFTVTINPTPATPVVSNVTACDSYTLPALAAGQSYNTAADGTGTNIPANTAITTTQTIWTVAQTGTTPNCFSSASFVVTINNTPQAVQLPNVTACDSYQLQPLPAGQAYNTASDGTGTAYNAGDVITVNGPMYVIASSFTTPNCATSTSFTITINPTPATPTVSNVTACDSYTLPALPAGQSYNTAADGTGTNIPANTAITTTQTVWTVAQTGTAPNCYSSASFTVTVNATPQVGTFQDVSACQQYVLPNLSVGGYYNGPGGTGGSIAQGAALTASQQVYVYAHTGTVPDCFTEASFQVTIVQPPVPVQPADIRLCDDNNDGFRCFDLSGINAQVTAGDTTLQTAIFLTAADAALPNNMVNALSPAAIANYCTIQPGHQTLYIREWSATAPSCAAVTQVELYVDASPVANDTIADFAQCDDDATPGTQGFTLSDHIPAITDDATGITFTFYHSQAGAQLPDAADQITAVPYVSAGETVWVRLENAAGCTDVASFQLVVWPLPAVNTPLAPKTECIGPAGTASFPLSSYIPAISQGIPGVTVTFHGTQLEAENGPQPSLASPYQTAGGTVWVRLDNAHCHVVVPLDLIGAVGPALSVPQPIAVCDDNNDCFATFDLAQTATQEQIWGGAVPAGVTFAYYLTQTDAGLQNHINEIAAPAAYHNINPCTQTVWVSVTAPGGTCNSVVPLDLIVRPRPEANESVAPYGLCDTDADGLAYFDLTTLTAQILNGMDPATHTVQFFAQAADVPANPILGTAAYQSAGGTLYVLVTDTLTGCTDTTTVTLEVYAQPAVAGIPPYRLCDDDFDQFVSFNLANYVAPYLQAGQAATFHHSQAEAEDGLAPIGSPYVNQTAAAELIWVRVVGAHGCDTVRPLDLVVEPKPVPFLPPANSPLLSSCDGNDDGMGSFDLAALAAYMQQGVPAAEMAIDFYLTQADALSGDNPIGPLPNYVNVDLDQQVIYAGVHNPSTQGDCRSAWPLTLTVLPSSQVIAVADLNECDTDADGLATFDLTVYETQILAAQTGTGPYTILYFTSQAAADLGSPPIGDPTAFDGSDGQTVWYRVLQGGCDTALGTVTLHVNSPAALPGNLGTFTRCGQATGQNISWDLTAFGAMLNLGSGYQYQYYHSLADAQGTGTGAEILPAGAYVNTGVAESLVIAVTDLATGCRGYVGFTIVVAPLPTPRPWNAATTGTVTACEDGTSGAALYDLTQFEAYLANGDANMSFSYYTDAAAAESGTGAITGDLTQYAFSGGTIYVRVEETTYTDYLTGQYCHVVVPITLIMNPTADLVAGLALQQCEYPVGSGQMPFDLHQIESQILASGDAADYTFAYSDASGPISAAGASAYTNTSSPQAITVTVTDAATGCAVDGTFDIVVKAGAAATAYAFAPQCDAYNDTTDGIALFDLTHADATVLSGQAPGQFTVSYYETQAQALSGTGAIQNPTAYESGTATLWAVVYNLGTGATPDPVPCHSDPVQVTLEVEAVPVPTVTGDATVCIDYATGIATPATLTASPSGNYTYDWYVGGQPAGLTGQSVQVDLAGDYTVVLTSNTALGCVSVASQAFTVTESSQPVQATYTISGAFQEHQSVQVNVQGVNPQAFEYSMDGGPWLSNGGLFTDVGPGEHTVVVRSACGQSDPLVVTLINYPHFFTPNGDGFNEVWNTYGLENDGRTKIYIFDRYGKLIKQIAPDPRGPESGNGWDGTFNGKPLPSTDYWFLVEYPDANANGAMKEFRAHFSLKR